MQPGIRQIGSQLKIEEKIGKKFEKQFEKKNKENWDEYLKREVCCSKVSRFSMHPGIWQIECEFGKFTWKDFQFTN